MNKSLDEKALRFGLAVTNIAASNESPVKNGWFIRRGHSDSKMNGGPFIEYVTDDGEIHRTFPANIELRSAASPFEATQAGDSEAVAYSYEDKIAGQWVKRVSTVKIYGSERRRNIKPLYAADPVVAEVMAANEDLGASLAAVQADNERLLDALSQIEEMHGCNPSDAFDGYPREVYLDYTLSRARIAAREARLAGQWKSK